MKVRGNEIWIVLVSVGLFAASFYLPAILLRTCPHVAVAGQCEWSGYRSLAGLQMLTLGLLGLATGNLAVLANPALGISWILLGFRQYKGAYLLSALALVLAVLTVQFVGKPLALDEEGTMYGYMAAPREGFICWVLSMLVVHVAALKAR
jgi:hypothetical protein